MDFKQNFFQIFQIQPGFNLDLTQLSTDYRALQKNVHPDKFAAASAQEKRLAVQWTAQINEAYDTLKSPLLRAIYLLKLQGVEIQHNPALEAAFLFQQIELREQLEAIESSAEQALEQLDQFSQQIKDQLAGYEHDFALVAVAPMNIKVAEQIVYKIQFVNKLLIAANQLEEKLLGY